jgi:DNA-directed RNA polymerase specialized sigma subunit
MTEQETRLWEKYRQEKSKNSLNDLITQYLPLVAHVFRKHYFRFAREEDNFISWGNQGLWRAVTTWQGEGVFLSYAYGCIMRDMHHARQFATTRQAHIVSGYFPHDDISVLTLHPTRYRGRDDLEVVIEKEAAQKELDRLFEDDEESYQFMLELYGNSTSSTEMYKKYKRKQRNGKKRWKNLISFKSCLGHCIRAAREKAYS